MADDFAQLETWLAPLIAALSDAERRKLATDVARELRRDNAASIRAQHGPNGETWAPRKRPLRDQKGQIRKGRQGQDMFTKLRAQRHLKARADGHDAVVEFIGRAARIAAVHHFGQRDSVKPGGAQYDYPERPLVGITDAFAERLKERLIEHLAAR